MNNHKNINIINNVNDFSFNISNVRKKGLSALIYLNYKKFITNMCSIN